MFPSRPGKINKKEKKNKKRKSRDLKALIFLISFVMRLGFPLEFTLDNLEFILIF